MKYLRAILCGIFLWTCVAVTFFILEHTPFIKDSLSAQTLIICILILFYSFFCASFYYRKTTNLSGLQVGVIISATAILLDVLIFVPFVEIPKGNTYQDFFSNPLLWILAGLNIVTVHFYWKKKFKIA